MVNAIPAPMLRNLAMHSFGWTTGLSALIWRALQAYQVFMVAVVLQLVGMGQ